jgi:hypothetical protein
MSKSQSRFEQYQDTSSYAGLMENHSLEDEGVWQVYGEDPNCDMGGSHVQPFLGMYDGKLIDVIRYAVELPNFWEWGSGGDIRKLGIPVHITHDSVQERSEDMKRMEQLTEALEVLKLKYKGR